MSKSSKFIFIIVGVVALFSLFVLFHQGITGFSAKRLNVQYITCQYLSEDNRGPCVLIERQFGTRTCNPSNTIDFASSKIIREMNLFTCKPVGTPKFFD